MGNPLWLTYAWSDNDEGDFDYLVQQLESNGIPTIYDKISLLPGRKLWKQIADKIEKGSLSAWAYLITPNSLSSAACQEELAYALQRAINTRGEEFPLIGLLHKVSIRDVPLTLRVRLCVNLANPDWIEEVRAGFEGIPPQRKIQEQLPYIIKIHNRYLNRDNFCAIEVRPRFGEITYWRLAFPSDGPQPFQWGAGPANGGGISSMQIGTLTGEYENIGGVPMKFIGAGTSLSPSTSAYAVFKGDLPKKFFFGKSNETFSTEAEGLVIELGKQEGVVLT
jgi:hypothetical protein